MCCFTGKVEEVQNTRIFARLGEHGNQVIIYQMSVNASQDLAMVLPIPVKEGTKEDAVIKTAHELSSVIRPPDSIRILGPTPAPLYRLRSKYRYRLLVRAPRSINLPEFMSDWLALIKTPSSLRVKLDMDPQSFL